MVLENILQHRNQLVKLLKGFNFVYHHDYPFSRIMMVVMINHVDPAMIIDWMGVCLYGLMISFFGKPDCAVAGKLLRNGVGHIHYVSP
jgi:hypothetical protein